MLFREKEFFRLMEEGKKRCIKCYKVKEHDKFSPKKNTTDGKHPYCKRCRAEYQRAYYHSLPKE